MSDYTAGHIPPAERLKVIRERPGAHGPELRALIAAAWDEGATAFQVAAIDPYAPIDNPYKEEA